MSLRVIDLFSGIGGFSLGLERAGMKTVAFCEIDPFCRRVLAKHWPNVPCHDDVTTMEFREGMADVVCGGFPCQDISISGKRAGLGGARSGLYRELVRAIRVVRPQYAILENVAALLFDGLGTVLGDLAEGGDCVEWDCVPAFAVGAPHERDRVWIVAHADGAWGQQSAISREKIGIWSRDGSQKWDANAPDMQGIGRGQGRPRRPPDSFARIRDEARRNFADASGEGLEGRPLSESPWRPQPESARRYFWPWPIRWPDEPAISRMDDGISYWMERTKATGNAVVPQIPELIGRAILPSREAGR